MRVRVAVLLAIAVAVAIVLAVVIFGGGDDGDEPRRPAQAQATRAIATAVGRDGRIVAVVERLEDGDWRPALVRDDDLAESIADLPFPATAVAVAGDGRIAVAGRAGRAVRVVWFTPNGESDGSATVPVDGIARGVVVTGNGETIVVADVRDGEQHAIAVARVGTEAVERIPDASSAGIALDRSGTALIAGTASDGSGAALLARLGPSGTLDLSTRAPTRLSGATWRAVAPAPDGGAVLVGSGRESDGRSLVAVQRFDRSGAPAGNDTFAAGDGDAFGAVARAAGGRVLIGANGVDGAYVATLGASSPPARRAPGRVAGIAPDGHILTSFWNGSNLTVVVRP